MPSFIKQEFFDQYPDWIMEKDLTELIYIGCSSDIRFSLSSCTNEFRNEVYELHQEIRENGSVKRIYVDKEEKVYSAVNMNHIYECTPSNIFKFFHYLPLNHNTIKIHKRLLKKRNFLTYKAIRLKKEFKDFKSLIEKVSKDFYGDNVVSISWQEKQHDMYPRLELTVNCGDFYIRNSRGSKHLIRGMVIRYIFRYKKIDGNYNFYFIDLQGRRKILTQLEHGARYHHSHLPRTSNAYFHSFCLGTSQVSVLSSFAMSTEDDLIDLFMGVQNNLAYEDSSNPFNLMRHVNPPLKHTRKVHSVDNYDLRSVLLINPYSVVLSPVTSEIRGLEFKFKPKERSILEEERRYLYDCVIENKKVDSSYYYQYYMITKDIRKKAGRGKIAKTIRNEEYSMKIISEDFKELSEHALVALKEQAAQLINLNRTENLYNHLYEQEQKQNKQKVAQ